MKKLILLAVVSMSSMAFADEVDNAQIADKTMYGAIKVGLAKPESTGPDYDPGVSMGLNFGFVVNENVSLGIDTNYIKMNAKNTADDLTLIPVLADATFAIPNEWVAKFYAGVLVGATAMKTNTMSDSWDFTLGGKFGTRFDITPELTLSPEIYGNNVFLGGNDYQIWGVQALLGMRF